jgi:raffinose/stachyose/melibiose transport system permease protein
MKKRRHHRSLSIQEKIITYVLLGILAFIMLYPIGLVINISLKSTAEYYRDPIGLVQTPMFSNYVTVFNDLQVLQKFFTTIVLSGVASTITVVSAALAAYPISRMHFKSAKYIYALILASMFFPTSLIANIVMMKDILGVYGSPISLILIWSIGGLQLYTFMFVGFLKQIPRELEEAAVMDGAGYFKGYISVVLPLMKPIIATVFILKIIGTWNDFLSPYIYISNPALRTLSTGLYTYMGQFSSRWNYLSVSIVLVALPMVILYLFLQKYIIEGIAAGAIKG